MDGKLTHINTDEALRYLGVPKNKADDELLSNINLVKNMVFSSAQPRVIYKAFDCLPFEADSKNIKDLLTGCDKVILFCATLGFETDRLIAKYQIKDMSLAVLLDAVSNCAIENVCDNFQSAFHNTTPRFSPGYGDFSICRQKDFNDILNINKIGVSVTDTLLLLPAKSVNALFGLKTQED